MPRKADDEAGRRAAARARAHAEDASCEQGKIRIVHGGRSLQAIRRILKDNETTFLTRQEIAPAGISCSVCCFGKISMS